MIFSSYSRAKSSHIADLTYNSKPVDSKTTESVNGHSLTKRNAPEKKKVQVAILEIYKVLGFLKFITKSILS